MTAYPRRRPYSSKPYRMYVASQECFGCGIEGYSQCAHEEKGKGTRLKSDDRRCFPLCGKRPGVNGCHVKHTMFLFGLTREVRREKEADYVARMQARATAAGWEIF